VVTRRVLVALVLVAALAVPVCGQRLRIVYTNDLHARLERLASVGERIAEVRESGDPVLLVDAGDAWQDFRVPLYAVWGAERVAEWMNRVGYDAMAPGNHDFYPGWSKVEALAAAAAFPVLCANLAPVDGTAAPFLGSVRVAVGGLDVLVVGLTALEDLPTLDIPWLRPVDPVRALQREIGAASGAPDLIVCLAHVPVREAETLALAVPEVDVFVTGHSHETTPAPVAVGHALIVQSGAFGRNVGELVLDVGDGAVRLVDNALLPTKEEAATDLGRGLLRVLEIVLGVLAFSLVLAL
jgi:2',3'-cyclic-nucleotide 2'-phosphodiesterase (5'-nucleotidase family)